VSDKGSRGERDDISGREVIRVLKEMPATVIEYEVIPDEKEIIKQKLAEYTDGKKLDLVITT